MKLETQRFVNLVTFKWKCAEYLNIDVSKLTDKAYADWLGIAPKYYSNWKQANKFMNSVSARKFEAKLQIATYSLDVMHIKDDIFITFQLDCMLKTRQYMLDNKLYPKSNVEAEIVHKIYQDGKAHGFKFNLQLLRKLSVSL